MPLMTAPIPDLSIQVIDPIIRQSLDRVVATLGFTQLFQDNIILKTKYSAVSDSSDSVNNLKLSTTRLVADINIQQNPNSVKWPLTTFHHSPAYGIGRDVNRRIPIFNDKELGLAIFEQGAPCSISMQCNMMFQDRNIGYSAASRLVNLYSSGNVNQVEDFMYTYRIPDELLATLGIIYQMKRFTTKFPTFFDYLKKWSAGIISLDSSRYTTNVVATVKKMTTGCLMSVEYSDDEPSPEMIDSSADLFQVQFTMYLQFQLINTLYFQYPVIIENNLIPIEAIPLNTSERYRTTLGTMEMKATSNYYLANWQNKIKQSYIQIPFYDDWMVPTDSRQWKYYQYPVLITACTIDEEDDINTIKLAEPMGEDYFLTDVVKEIIKKQEAIRKGGSFHPDAIIHLSVYYGERQLNWNEFILDTDKMELKYKGRMLNKPFHFVISECTNIHQLNSIYYPILFEYRYFFSLAVVNKLKYLINGGKGWSFEWDMSKLDKQYHIDENGTIYDTLTGMIIGHLNNDGSWTDKDGNRHDIGYIKDKVGDSHGRGIIHRILACDIVAAHQRSDGQVTTREQYAAYRVR